MPSHDPSAANPYQAPGAADADVEFVEIPDTDASNRLTERTVEALAGTQPWVKVIAWVALLAGVARCIQSIMAERQIAELGTLVLLPGIINLCVGVILTVGGVLLVRYSGRIGDFVISRRVDHLDSALEAQRSFWRFFGAGIAMAFILVLAMILLLFWVAGSAAIGERFWR